MRKTIIIFLVSLIAVSCGKDNFTTAPQIEFKSVEPNAVPSGITSVDSGIPIITLKVTDREGDFGDTAFVYIRRIINSVPHYKVDSFRMPDIRSIAEKNFSLLQFHLSIIAAFHHTNRKPVFREEFECYFLY